MSLWEHIVALYERPGVAEACLTLQDEHGQHTSLLLWAAWARSLDPERITRAVQTARAWDEAALLPLRAARRAMKAPLPPIEDAGRILLREGVKAAELDAEKLLVDALERLGAPGDAEPWRAMAAVSAAWGRPPPPDTLGRLAALIG